MPQVTVTVHRNGLHPMEAFKAHHKSQELGMSLDEILTEGEIRTLSGRTPGRYAGWLSDSIRLRKKACPICAHTQLSLFVCEFLHVACSSSLATGIDSFDRLARRCHVKF